MILADGADEREAARRRLPRFLFDYIDGGSYEEATLRRNRQAFSEVALRQRVLRDVSDIRTSVDILGERLSMPVALGPVGFAGMFARRGEAKAARAAAAAGVPFCLSTVGVCPLPEVRAAADAPIWFQLYMIKDRGHMEVLLRRAWDLGTRVLLFTVDLPVSGSRYRDVRSGFSARLPPLARARRALNVLSRPAWVFEVFLRGRPHHFGNIVEAVAEGQAGDFAGWINRNFDPGVTWRDIDWVRSRWPGRIALKGVMDVDDARSAVEAGVDGLIVSNHGGRQLDGTPASIEALPIIAEAVGDRLEVLMDGGVRSGLDVLKAMALGARGVLLGRAWAYALASGGETGVAAMLERLRAELKTAMALTGLTAATDADRSVIFEGAPSPSALSPPRRRSTWP